MVYVYVCKRFKVTMDMVSGKDSEWILNLVKFYLKKGGKKELNCISCNFDYHIPARRLDNKH